MMGGSKNNAAACKTAAILRIIERGPELNSSGEGLFGGSMWWRVMLPNELYKTHLSHWAIKYEMAPLLSKVLKPKVWYLYSLPTISM
jgi:hypothetical protein